jgi:hypothetical protein
VTIVITIPPFATERIQQKERLKRLCEQELPDLLDLIPIRQPDKDPTELEKLKLTDEFYPEYILQIQQLKQQLDGLLWVHDSGVNNEDWVGISTQKSLVEREFIPGNLLESSPPRDILIYSSDVESYQEIDSIADQADFISCEIE